MAAKFKKIDPRVWDDESFAELNPGQKLVALYVVTAQSNRCGLFRYSHALAIEQTGIQSDSYQRAFGKVIDTLRWRYDERRRVMLLPTWWKYNAPENPKHLIGCLADLHDVPQTELLKEFWNNDKYLPDHCLPAWRDQKGKLSDSYTDRSAISGALAGAGAGAGALAGALAGASKDSAGAESSGETRSASSPAASGTGAPAKKPAKATDDSPIVLTFDCDGEPAEWHLRERKVAEYAKSFPAMDVIAALRAARQWVIDNPTRRPTARGAAAFCSRWLNKAQNRREHRKDGSSPTAAPVRRHEETPDAYAARLMRERDAKRANGGSNGSEQH